MYSLLRVSRVSLYKQFMVNSLSVYGSLREGSHTTPFFVRPQMTSHFTIISSNCTHFFRSAFFLKYFTLFYSKFWLCEYVILKLRKKTTFKTRNIFLENSLYAMGGFDSTNYQSSVERLDPRQIINTTRAPITGCPNRNFY